MQRLIVTFRKSEGARFLSHLDLVATLEFAIRRARLPIALAEGFNPRPRMSVPAALPLGHIGERELLELTLREPRDPENVCHALAAALPPGIDILTVAETDPERRPSAARVRSVDYRVDLPKPVQLGEAIGALLARSRIEIEEEHDGGVRKRDLRPLLLALHQTGPTTLRVELRFDETGSMRPEAVLDLLGLPREGARFIREGINLT